MDWKKSKKLLCWLAALYWIMVIAVYLIAGSQFKYLRVSSDVMSPSSSIGEVTDGMLVSQRMRVPADRLESIELLTTTFYRTNSGKLLLSITDDTGAVLSSSDMDVSAFEQDAYTPFILSEPLEGLRGQTVFLNFSTEGCYSGNAISIYFGNSVVAGRFDIVKQIADEEKYILNGQMGDGLLCARLNGVQLLSFYKTYWYLVTGVFALGAGLCVLWWKQAKAGRNNPLVMLCTLYTRYGFLIRQLVKRDFKAKYKRSTLGMMWSFFNPLLTMLVQYIVFSTLFKSDIPNYPVYLLTGIVFMNFFSEAVSTGMTSIVSNAALIKKVYMPKYIYPGSKLMSSLINFLIALIPLFLVMLITGILPKPSLFLLVFDILCLLGFILGMILLLTTSMTFFQDTQFLWGVVSMMWMYLTPVFYPETIIPSQFLTLYHMNPMYQYITFARICIIDGVSPEPMAYLWCIISALTMLVLGTWTFRKNQDTFVLYL